MTLKAGGGGYKHCPLFDITHLQEKRKHISNEKKVISTPTTNQDQAQTHINIQSSNKGWSNRVYWKPP